MIKIRNPLCRKCRLFQCSTQAEMKKAELLVRFVRAPGGLALRLRRRRATAFHLTVHVLAEFLVFKTAALVFHRFSLAEIEALAKQPRRTLLPASRFPVIGDRE
jgi:hypothetical protein